MSRAVRWRAREEVERKIKIEKIKPGLKALCGSGNKT